PILLQFEPDLVIMSAGFDAHERDPLGGMRLSTAAFAGMTADLRSVAEECCRGRLVGVTEGGYDLHALAASIEAVLEVLNAPAPAGEGRRWVPSGIQSTRGQHSADAARHALRAIWRV